MKLEMLHDRVLIERHRPEEGRVTPGGVHIPDEVQKKEKIFTASVIEVSMDVNRVKKGDIVILSHFTGTDIKLADRDNVYTIVGIEDILAIVHEEAEDGVDKPSECGKL